jgi:hypothetical protein
VSFLVADTDTAAMLTMRPTVLTTLAGDPATKWRRIAAVTIVQPLEAAPHLDELTDPRLLPARCRLFRHVRIPVARGHVEVQPDKDLSTGKYHQDGVQSMMTLGAGIKFGDQR